jgi:erythromycin esterase-like protein
VVADDVHHEVHAARVQRVGERAQFRLGAEVGSDGLEVPSGIAVVLTPDVDHHRADPDRLEPQALDVVELLHDPHEVAAVHVARVPRAVAGEPGVVGALGVVVGGITVESGR